MADADPCDNTLSGSGGGALALPDLASRALRGSLTADGLAAVRQRWEETAGRANT